MSKNSSIQSPATLRRRQRIEHFREYIDKHRQNVNPSKMKALYSIETGITITTLDSYMKVLIDAGIYRYGKNWMLISAEEYEAQQEKLKRRQEEVERKRKEEEAAEAKREAEWQKEHEKNMKEYENEVRYEEEVEII